MGLSTHATEDKFFSVARQMGNWVDKVLKPSYHGYHPGQTWSPAVNVFEDATHHCIVVELAGVHVDEVDLRVEGDRPQVLLLSGQRTAPGLDQADRQSRLHTMEIDHGRFCRAIQVPDNVEMDRIEATYKNGLLRIRLPKKS